VEKNGFIPVGKVIGVHGLNGTTKVYSYAESLSVFEPNSSILLMSAGGGREIYYIKWVKPHARGILLGLKEITNRDQAQKLVGSEILIERIRLPELENGAFYWCDIIGLSVFSSDGEYLGRVASIIATGSNDVYVVKNPDNSKDNEILIPAIESVVQEIDLERQTMRVDLPEGL
jgi:16S rRNA processing protein RimM